MSKIFKESNKLKFLTELAHYYKVELPIDDLNFITAIRKAMDKWEKNGNYIPSKHKTLWKLYPRGNSND